MVNGKKCIFKLNRMIAKLKKKIFRINVCVLLLKNKNRKLED